MTARALGLLVLLATAWACGGGGDAPQGGADQVCYPNGTCNAGLACDSGRCEKAAPGVLPPPPAPFTGASGSGGGSGTAGNASGGPTAGSSAGAPGLGEPCVDPGGMNPCSPGNLCVLATSDPLTLVCLRDHGASCTQDSECTVSDYCDAAEKICVQCGLDHVCDTNFVCNENRRCVWMEPCSSNCGGVGAGTGGTAGGGGAGGVDPGPDTSHGIWGMLDGELVGSSSALVGPLTDTTGPVGFQIADSGGFNVAIVGTAAVGTYPCSAMGPPSPGAALAYDDYWLSWAARGSCTVTLSEFSMQSGGRISGTFSGVLPSSTHTPPLHTVMQGTFAVSWP